LTGAIAEPNIHGVEAHAHILQRLAEVGLPVREELTGGGVGYLEASSSTIPGQADLDLHGSETFGVHGHPDRLTLGIEFGDPGPERGPGFAGLDLGSRLRRDTGWARFGGDLLPQGLEGRSTVASDQLGSRGCRLLGDGIDQCVGPR
jgi:hypothetical protein